MVKARRGQKNPNGNASSRFTQHAPTFCPWPCAQQSAPRQVLGLLVWDLFDKGQLQWDLAAMALLALIWIQPLLQGQAQVSMAGHFYGIVAGLIAAFLFPQSRIALANGPV